MEIRSTATILVLTLSLVSASLPAAGSPPLPESFSRPAADLATVERRELPALDAELLRRAIAKAEAPRFGEPYVFAEPRPVSFDLESSGSWETLGDGSRLWRLRLASPAASSLNLGFRRFDLPPGARLWIYDPDGGLVQGPYSAPHRTAQGELWTPIVEGSEVVVELHVPASARGPLALEIGSVNHGFAPLLPKQGGCNIDVACPQGDAWSDQIRSVVRYTISGFTLCTGNLVNNTAQDGRPLVLSAAHCGGTPTNAGSIVVYWNFQSPTCGQLSGGSLAQNQTGAVFLASDARTDAFLFVLNQVPDTAFDVYYSGWDAGGQVPQSSVSIHHPSGDEKAISLEDDPAMTVDVQNFPSVPVGPISWEVIWDQGTTEGGSSGSGLWDASSGLLVGHLWGGAASCTFPDQPDYYGKLSLSWEGGGTPSSRLKDHLDPLDSGALALTGRDPGTPSGSCQQSDTVMCLNGGRFRVEAGWRDFEGGSGPGRVVQAGTDDSGLFYFFAPDNWEMLVKVLEGCPVNDHFWVFAAATTNVEYTLTVTDTATGDRETYSNPLGQRSPAIVDTTAFATCP